MNISTIEELEAKITLLEAENKLLKQKEFNFLKALPEIVFMVDINERVTFLNNSCFDKFKLNSSALKAGLYLSDIITNTSLIQLRKKLKNHVSDNNVNSIEVTAIKQNGVEFPMIAFFSRIFENNTLVGFIGHGFDTSNHKAIEQKLTESNYAKVKFFSIIAHDLKNPFNSLVGFSNLLLANLEKYPIEKTREYIGYISRSANQAFLLLDNLLEWSRAQSGKLEIVPEHINIIQAIEETTGLLQTNIEKKEITLLTKGSANIYGYADYNMIKTVIRNVLSNAIKFTYRRGTIKIHASVIENYAVIEIIDNGIGICPENLKTMFNIDNEFNTLGTERENGTGLGLVLCNEFMTQNHGSIEVDSKLGEGSTFRLKIPLFEGFVD